MYNLEGKIGGDSHLSSRGVRYAQALPSLVTDIIGDASLTVSVTEGPDRSIPKHNKVWTSTLQRTIETARELPYTKLTWKALDELDAGVCDGMTYEEIEVTSFSYRLTLQFTLTLFRLCIQKIMLIEMMINSIIVIEVNCQNDSCAQPQFLPGGESYRDVVVRLEPVIMELERQENILIIGHQVSCCSLLSDFTCY
jgi:6-phosphofructo-2-kinase/fructose-2,6-biphosphatase 2